MRDRYGEEVEDTDVQESSHDKRCTGGWIDRDAAVPCLKCKPHLIRVVRRRRGRSPPHTSHPTGTTTS